MEHNGRDTFKCLLLPPTTVQNVPSPPLTGSMSSPAAAPGPAPPPAPVGGAPLSSLPAVPGHCHAPPAVPGHCPAPPPPTAEGGAGRRNGTERQRPYRYTDRYLCLFVCASKNITFLEINVFENNVPPFEKKNIDNRHVIPSLAL